jgi:hypothetical protein
MACASAMQPTGNGRGLSAAGGAGWASACAAIKPPAATAHRHTADGKTTGARGAATERDDGMANGVIEGQSI